jgi:hypothetical protein
MWWFSDQCKSLMRIRRECPEYLAVNAQSAQVTLRRLDKAFAAFFRHVKDGDEEPGFPASSPGIAFPASASRRMATASSSFLATTGSMAACA